MDPARTAASTTPTHRRRRSAASAGVVALLALAAGGCGSTDDGGLEAGATTTAAAPGSSTTTVDDAPTSTTTGPAPTTTGAPTTTAAPTTCDTDGWQAVENPAFRFLLPAGVVDQHAQGIDSLVGRYLGSGLQVDFDFGWYSSDLADLREHGTPIAAVVDGLDAEIVAADLSGLEGYNGDHITGLHVPAVTGTSDGTPSALAMWVAFDDPALAATADCIVRSVDFL